MPIFFLSEMQKGSLEGDFKEHDEAAWHHECHGRPGCMLWVTQGPAMRLRADCSQKDLPVNESHRSRYRTNDCEVTGCQQYEICHQHSQIMKRCDVC